MRALFFVLFLANVAVLALIVQPLPPAGVEPERLTQQLNADRISVIDPTAAALQAAKERLERHRVAQERASQHAQAAQEAPRAGTPPAAADAPSSTLAKAVCVELGDFSAQAAESFEPQLSRLSMTGIPQRRVVQPPPSYLVFIPPQATDTAAAGKLAQLREQGFADSAVIREDSPRRRGVSVGLFSKEELAMAQVEKLHRSGFADARMGEHPLNSTRYAYRLPGVTETGATRLAAVASGYAGVTVRPCK